MGSFANEPNWCFKLTSVIDGLGISGRIAVRLPTDLIDG